MKQIILFLLLLFTQMAVLADTVLVIGSTRNTGLEVATLLKQSGIEVIGLARDSSDKQGLEERGIPYVIGDAMDIESIRVVFSQYKFDLVVSTLGSSMKDLKKGIRPDWEGARNTIDVAKEHDVKLFVMMSTIGVDETYDAVEPKFQKLLKKTFDLKSKAEAHLRNSGINYTIYRAGGLINREATGKSVLTQDPTSIGIISRKEVARVMVEGLNDKNKVKQTYSLFDPSLD